MNLLHPAYHLLPMLPAQRRDLPRRHRRSLSAITKKPASPAGFLYFTRGQSRRAAPYSFAQPPFLLPALPSVDYSNSR